MTISVLKAKNKFDYARCIQVRTIVFTVGQAVPAEREIDAEEDESIHFLALDDGQAIGTGRWRKYGTQKAKIERIAVLDCGRRKGIGRAIMQAILDDIHADDSVEEIILGAQDQVIPFYESLGFKAEGDGYMDGGTIPHHDMRLVI